MQNERYSRWQSKKFTNADARIVNNPNIIQISNIIT